MRIPLRTCIGCYQAKSKDNLIRIVRSPDSSIKIDLKNSETGRGAYICPDEACINKAMRIDRLNRAFKIHSNSLNKSDVCETENTKIKLLEFIKH